MVEVVNLLDARFEAERAKRNVDLADELARLRRRSWELMIMRDGDPSEIAISQAGTLLAERERDFWVTQALSYSALLETASRA